MRFLRSGPWSTAAGPLLFSLAFLTPLIAQSLEAASVPTPFGVAPTWVGLGIALPLGIVAALRGRWV